MAAKVVITGAKVIKALNAPGAPVREFTDDFAKDARRIAIATAPVNNPLDAMHRGGVVGTYKASFRFDRRGTKGHRVIARVYNTARHAEIVELGRSASRKRQEFSWTVWGGEIQSTDFTGPREGRHTLRDAFRQAQFFALGFGVRSG